MRVETTTKTVPIYDVQYDEYGEIISIEQIGEETVTIIDIYADAGNVLIEKATGKVLSDHITLGTDDSVENYGEISKELIV